MGRDDYYLNAVDYYADKPDWYVPATDYYAPTVEPPDLALGNKQPLDMNFELTLQAGGFLNLNKHEQLFVGDNSNRTIALDSVAYLASIEVRIITLGPVPNSIEWLYGYHWRAEVDGDGFATEIAPIAPARWPNGAPVRLLYNTKAV